MLEIVVLVTLLMLRFGRDFSGLSDAWLEDSLRGYEERWGQLTWTIILSVILVACASIYARLDTTCTNLGYQYATLASDPFSLIKGNPCSYRILTPLISYSVGLRGRGIIVTNLLISMVMVGIVYWHFKKRSGRFGDGFLAAVTVTFSLVILTSIHCGGYCDILTYLIVFLMWKYRAKRIIFFLLFLAGLFNRESIVFLLPWFAFLRLREDGKWYGKILDLLIGFGVGAAVYYLFRQWVASHAEIHYSLGYYLGVLKSDPLKLIKATFYYQSIGLFSVFKALWVFPCLAAVAWWKRKNYKSLLGIAIILISVYTQLFFAFDTSRLFTLGFMVMLVSLEFLFDTDFAGFRKWAFWAVLFNLAIPQIYTARKVVEVWHTLSSAAISGWLQ